MCPKGKPNLGPSEITKVHNYNVLLDFTWKLFEMALRAKSKDPWRVCRSLGEHPEDIGSSALSGEHGEPAFIWDEEASRDLDAKGIRRGACFQCWLDDTIDYQKPTGIQTEIPGIHASEELFLGLPDLRPGRNRQGQEVTGV